MQQVNFTGGTGYVSFDVNGDRPGYSGKEIAGVAKVCC